MAGNDVKLHTGPKPPSVKVFNCPKCGSNVSIRAVGQSISVVCNSCSSIIDTTDENYKILSTVHLKAKRKPIIPLGTRGKLHGTLWEVIGYMERCDGAYCWSEYLLYNPMKGFRWLTEFDGHWNYVVPTKETPKVIHSNSMANYGRHLAKLLGKTYTLFHRGTAKTRYVIGEFYWKASADEKARVEDYILPPEILSCETTNDEVIWSIGEYIAPEVVLEAFPIAKPLPPQIGVAPNQPSTVQHVASGVIKYWGLFLGILFALQFLFILASKNETVLTNEFVYDPKAPEKVIATEPFELKYGVTNLEIDLSAPVQNSWLELQAELVNDDDGETRDFEQGVEYYSGYDSDGSWSEGSRYSSLVLSAVPPGKYHLNVSATAGAGYAFNATSAAQEIPYRVAIKRDVITWSNFIWSVIFLSIYPLIVWWRNRSFELSRWSQSDFSPYYSHQEES